jgi:hypothetical protein
MGDVINLNKFRKQKERADKAKTAEQNRLKHGESKVERARREKQKALEAKKLEGHKLDE